MLNAGNSLDYLKMPQGMAYGWWAFHEQWLESLEFEVEIVSGDERSPGRYFQLYHGHVGTCGMYMGFQTDVQRPGMGGQGKGLIFSRWGTRDSADACPCAGGWVENGDHEDGFVGVRSQFNWRLGRYQCWLGPTRTDAIGTWYEFRVDSLDSGEAGSAGSLRFPNSGTARALIASGGGSWTEVYGSNCIRRESIPPTHLTVRITANNGALRPCRCDTSYNDSFTDADCFVSPDDLLHLISGHGVVRTHAGQSSELLRR